jgi:lambda repressor-like predicted transcriptional regulator
MDETKDGKQGRRRSRAQIAALLAGYRESGLTQRAYAARAGVSLSSLVRWLHRGVAGAEAPAEFAAVQLRPEASRMPEAGVTIRWPQGVEVELPLSLGEATLRRWLGRFLAPCSR